MGRVMSQNDEFTVIIPKSLVKNLRNRIKNTKFTSLTQYIIYLIRKALVDLMEDTEEQTVYTKEEEMIKKPLRELGYID